MIPRDWEVKEFGEISSVRKQKYDSRKSGSHNFCVELEHIGQGSGNLIGSTETSAFSSLKNVFQKDDVLFGRLRAYLKKYWKANRDGVASSEIWPLIANDSITIPEYIFQLVQTKSFIETASEAYGTHMPRSDWNVVKKKQIPLPPSKAEQIAIATVLSDADALIISLEKLIAKKRNIKQGAMQELLTDKKRLPGFSGKWEVKKLGVIGEITGAGVDKKIKPDEVPVRLVNYLDVYRRDFIYSRYLNHHVTAPPTQAQRCSVKKGDIFFTPSSEMPFDIGISAVAMEDIPDAAYSYHVVRLRLIEDWDLAFRAYIFKTRYFLNQAETFCEGSGTRYVITQKRFRELTIYYPIDKAEQTAIAKTLSDMDAEIEQLEQKLDKFKMIKQGMMQELLTGKTRLI